MGCFQRHDYVDLKTLVNHHTSNGLNSQYNRDKGIKTNYSGGVALTRQLNTATGSISRTIGESWQTVYVRWDASASQDLGLHGVEPVTFTHSKLYFHSVVWIIVKEKTTVDHKLCIWPSAIKNVNLRCSKEKIKGYKRNLTSILSTKQGKGSVLIHLAGLYTKDGQPWRNHTLFWRPRVQGRPAGGGERPPRPPSTQRSQTPTWSLS